MNLKAVPLEYRGITFRSTLEADWAATFDSLGIYWQYEPLALLLPSGQMYLPDFYLPTLKTWAEVKGPHMERFAKAAELSETLRHAGDGPGWKEQVHVVVLEAAGPGNEASWRLPDEDRVLMGAECGEWDNRFTWYDTKCWCCNQENIGALHYFYWPASAIGRPEGAPAWKMARAPRPGVVASIKKGGE